MIDRLTRRKVGINEIEEVSKKMTGRGGRRMSPQEIERERQKFVTREMSVRKLDALEVLNKSKHIYEKPPQSPFN